MPAKRLTALLLTLLCCILLLPEPVPAKAISFAPTDPIASESAILLNLDLDTVVYEKNADMKQMPATLAQVMTAIVVLESGVDIETETVTAQQAWFDPLYDYESPTDLRYAEINAGDVLTVEDLLYAMLLTSSCEAATMLAMHFGEGDESAFVDKMNTKAQVIGMPNTRFTNAVGLYSARQVTTARDMMQMLRYAMTVPRFENIACAARYTPASAELKGKTDDWTWTHSNIMCDTESKYFCTGVKGIKTGNLQEWGRAIACKASRDGNNYLLVCLKSPMYDENGASRFYHLEDATTIIEWAFSHLSYQKLLTTNTEIDEVKVENAKDTDYVIVKPAVGYSCIWCDTMDINLIQQIITIDENVQAPVKEGQKLGTIKLKHSGEVLAEIDLIAASSVERSFWSYNLSIIPGFFQSDFLGIAWKSALWLSVIYLVICIVCYIIYRRQKAKHPRPRRTVANDRPRRPQ